MSKVREYFDDAPGDANVGQSMAKSFQIFLGMQNDHDGLNWVYQATDRVDRRMKYLMLTADGADAANSIIRSMKNAKEKYREQKDIKQED